MSWNHTTISTFAVDLLDKIKNGYHVLGVVPTGEIIDCMDIGNNTISFQKAFLRHRTGQDYVLEEYFAIKDLDCDGCSSTGTFLYTFGDAVSSPELLYRTEDGDLITKSDYDVLASESLRELPDIVSMDYIEY